MAEIRARPGQVVLALTLLRKLLPTDMLISHYDADMKVWKIDSCHDGFRVADPSKQVAFQIALEHLLLQLETRRRLKPKQPNKGRPRKIGRVTASYSSTKSIQIYLSSLARACNVSQSTMINYLIVAAHGAFRDKIAGDAMPIDETDVTDGVAVLEALREKTISSDFETAKKREAKRELKEALEAQSRIIAQQIRADIEKDEPKKPNFLDEKSKLLELEERARNQLKENRP